MDDTISHMCYAIHVQPGYEVDGELLLGEKRLYFIAGHIGEEDVRYVFELMKTQLLIFDTIGFFFKLKNHFYVWPIFF